MTSKVHVDELKGLLENQAGRKADLVVVYDGQCIFCNSYVKLTKLRASAGDVLLVDARANGVASSVREKLGLDLDDGIARAVRRTGLLRRRRHAHAFRRYRQLARLERVHGGGFQKTVACRRALPLPESRTPGGAARLGRSRIRLTYRGRSERTSR